MKNPLKQFLAGAALILIPSSLMAQAVPSIAANVLRSDGSNFATYVVGGDEEGILASPYETGVQPKKYPYSGIKEIEWREPDDWKLADDLYTKRKWEEAIVAYHAFFEKYRALKDIEDSFTGIAKFRECNCLRRLGKYNELATEYENLQRAKLSERYAIQSRLFNAWGHVGNELYGALNLIATSYQVEDSSIPAGIVRPAGLPLKNVDPQSLMQIAFLRGISEDKLTQKDKTELDALIAKEDERDRPEIAERSAELIRERTVAMNDYARAMTLTFGSEPTVVKDSLLNSLAMVARDPKLEEIYMKKREAHSLAVLYSKLFPGSVLPSEYTKFLAPPAPPEEE